MTESAEQSAQAHRTSIVDFFNSSYGWWHDVYDATLPKKFFSFEMRKRRELVVRLLEKHAPQHPQAQILECGCGPGGILQLVDTRRYRLTGVDLNPQSLSMARATVGGAVNWIQGDIEQLPFPDHAFDLVCCVGVLSYLQQDERAIAEMARVVKPGGIVLLSLPNWMMLNKLCDPYYYLVWIWKRLFARGAAAPQGGRFGTGMIRRYRRATIAGLFAARQLKAIEQTNVSFGPLTFWRREFLPLRWSERLSDGLLTASRCRGLTGLDLLTNHWITCFQKAAS